MKNVKKIFLSIAFLGLYTLSFSQGIIRGTVIEDATGEPLFGVTAVIQGTTTGSSTDFDGKFEIKVAPGTYNLQISFISFKTVIIENLEVTEGEVTLVNNIRLLEDSEVLEEVVVTAEVLQTTEEALLTVKRKSVNLFDGISSATFKKIGDSNAASAVKRVPGVSIEGGKYVYVRGLGDRYTKSILNGVDIPGLDPDRNTLQMDIFPTNVIDNIIVIKAFTADLPADFTGGIVDISTKEFPDEKSFNISGSLGYNPNMHFNSDYLSYEGGDTDWLGFDDGTRDIPTGRSTNIPFAGQTLGTTPRAQQAAADYQEILEEFNPTLGAMRDNSFMDYSLGFSIGNQISGEKNTIGYNASFSYKNETEYYENIEYGLFEISDDRDVLPLEFRERQTGSFGVNNVLLGGLLGVALKRDFSKYKINVLHLQNGESKAALYDYTQDNEGAVFTATQHNLEYSERSISNMLFSGKHFNADGTWEAEWKVSPTISRITDPDIRFTRVRTGGGNPFGTEVGLPERIWRYLEEDNIVGKFDIKRKLQVFGRDANLKFGSNFTYKQRDYEIQNFQITVQSSVNQNFSGDVNDLFSDENLDGVDFNAQFVRQSSDPEFYSFERNTNKFDSEIRNLGFYTSFEFSPFENLKTILGLRVEDYEQLYSGENQQNVVFDEEVVLDDLDFFPSVNLIYALKSEDNNSQNLRFSFSRTIARPSFKEASFAEIIDPITGRTFIGGFAPDIDATTQEIIWDGNLTKTDITNLDLRWEAFQRRGQTVALSVFYKTFNNPIEIVQYIQAPNNFQPRNVGDGTVLGAELEFRQSLSLISPSLADFMVNGNVTITESQIDMSTSEFLSREVFARNGQTIDDTRKMAGQAPYIINAGITYVHPDNGLDAGLFYNVQGRTLLFVGTLDRPDVFTEPFHSLNLSIGKEFGVEKRVNTRLKIDNILGDKRENFFTGFNANDEVFSRLAPGTTISFSLGYKIW